MKQEMLERWANRYAAKLGLTEAVRVRPAQECPDGQRGTHCHTKEHRGLVCWGERPARPDRRGWRWIIAHEVCHFKVKSHHSAYFARWMASLGFARERRVAVAAGLVRHRHDWRSGSGDFITGLMRRRCADCGATQEGKVSWGPTQKRKGN